MKQLDLFDPTDIEATINRCIDEALHHVENQHVLTALLSGKSWGEAFGIGGRAEPGKVGWRGDSKGITLQTGELITPRQIMERASRHFTTTPNGGMG